MSLYAWLDVVLWIFDDLVPCQSGSASQVHRHMVLANSPGAQTPKYLPGSEIEELESSPHQWICTGGQEETDLLFFLSASPA